MTLVLDSIKSDLKREEEGDWEPSPSFKGVRYRVSALTRRSYVVKRGKLFEKLAEEFGEEGAPPDVVRTRLGALFVEEILHDWDGFDVAFSTDAARAALTDPAHRSLYLDIEAAAARLSRVNPKFLERAAKNSEPPSGGGSKGKAAQAS